jgi:hypothetical protein
MMFSAAAILISCTYVAAADSAASAPAASQTAAASQPAGAFEGRARALVEMLAKERFDQAYGRFDPTMRQVLPVEKLAQAWHELLDQAGPLQRIISVQTQRINGYDAVYVTCQFDRQRLEVEIAYDEMGRMAGLHFVPATLATGAITLPPYADPAAFEERPVQVGAEGWPLPGTLTLPRRHRTASAPASAPAASAPTTSAPAGIAPADALWPAVVLVHGSGPQDRDETLGANRPFRDLAWGLATRGIVVLRYEKRTQEHTMRVGTQLKTITVREEVIDDAVTAVRRVMRVEGVDPNRVFILGHSFGGTLAPRIARAADEVAGMVILAGTTRRLPEVILDQARFLRALKGGPDSDEEQHLRWLTRQVKAAENPGLSIDTPAEDLPMGIPASYWIDLRSYDPVATARLVGKPMLILQGGRDWQVTAADLAGWKTGLAGMENVQIKEYPALNHLMIAGAGRSTPLEYNQAGHVDAQVVGDIAEWILSQK